MKIRWLNLALKDLESIIEFISEDSPSVANKITKIIYEKVQLLAVQPHLGRTGRVEDTRELIIEGTPFIIPYRVKNKEIQILRVFHSSRRWPENFK